MPPAVSASAEAIAVAVAPNDLTAYVLSTYIDTACDGQVAAYAIGADGALSPTGFAILTGNHVNPVGLVTAGSGLSAYLLANVMGVDTNMGAVYQYSIDSAGGLLADTPPSLSVTSGAVAEGTSGDNLYALSANAVGFVSGLPPGGHVDRYTIGPGGQLTAVSTTVVAGSLPTAMALAGAQ